MYTTLRFLVFPFFIFQVAIFQYFTSNILINKIYNQQFDVKRIFQVKIQIHIKLGVI